MRYTRKKANAYNRKSKPVRAAIEEFLTNLHILHIYKSTNYSNPISPPSMRPGEVIQLVGLALRWEP